MGPLLSVERPHQAIAARVRIRVGTADLPPLAGRATIVRVTTGRLSESRETRTRTTMKLEPVGDKVIVRRSDPEEETAGGILLPSASQSAPLQGRVLSVGDGRRLPDGTRVTGQVQEGDRVVFHSYAGMEIVVEEEKLLILSEDEILAVLD